MTQKIQENHRIALIGPDFFSYIQAIRDSIIARGFYCIYIDERHSNSISSKIAYRLQATKIIEKKKTTHLNEVFQKIIDTHITDIFLIDTEVIDIEFIKLIKNNNIRVHLYMWDSAYNKGAFLKLLPYLDSKASFEPSDCENFDMNYIPLFAEDIFSSKSNNLKTHRSNTIVFSGTLHSQRAKLLQEIENNVCHTKFKIKKILYYYSKILFLIKCIRNPKSLRFINDISTKSFTKQQIAYEYFSSKAILDIHHPGQDGLTSRTFEALRAGNYLITFNKTIKTLPKDFHKRIILISSTEELINHIDKINEELNELNHELDYFLSLDRFVDNLLNLAGINRGL